MSVAITRDLKPVVVRRETAVVVTRQCGETVVVRQLAPAAVFVTRGVPGLRGQQGIPGPAGGAAFVRRSAGALSALRVVWEDDAGVVRALGYDDDAHIDLISGLTLTAAASAGDVTVQRSGPVDDAAWNWTPGRVWLGAGGALVQAPPVDGNDVLIGYAVSQTRLYLDIQDPISLED